MKHHFCKLLNSSIHTAVGSVLVYENNEEFKSNFKAISYCKHYLFIMTRLTLKFH